MGEKVVCIHQIDEEADEKAADRMLFSFLVLLTKLIKDCNFLQLQEPSETLANMWSKTKATWPPFAVPEP